MAKFKTRARTIDMLGRQQIAGIPTAISELFKNAHDAYADRVEVDYYRAEQLFVLRDDGLGMTREEFESRWLTLGTESKLNARSGLYAPPATLAKPPRTLLGEKGIGRLAIAAIGPQVFVLSRAIRDGELKDTVAAYIHWKVFELPGIDLDEIEIPIRTFANGRLPDADDVELMLSEFQKNIARFAPILDDQAVESFYSDFEEMRMDLSEVEYYVPDLSLSEEGHGTHFIIRPAYEILETDIDESADDRASNLEKLLLGFTNTMTPGHVQPVIKTAFRDHRTEETFDDLVDEERFFVPSEFENADHRIQGRFDEYGQFVGIVSVYGDIYEGHKVPWPKAQGKKTLCGPFNIEFASIQGAARETTLPLEEHTRLLSKTNRIGGLYIYKDGIRILPYGDTDYDWLEIEKRRSKHASYYYFSYRRIFGAIELTSKENFELSEKAGREGFRESKAYRQFRDILKNFFVQIAADFFRDDGTYGERFNERKSELTRLEMARRRRESHVNEKKRRLNEQLESFFSSYDDGKPHEEALELAELVAQDLQAALSIVDPQQAARSLMEVESAANKRLRQLEDKYRIVKPRGIGLGRRLQQDYDNYISAFNSLQTTTFSQARDLIEGEVTSAANRARIDLDRRIRIERALQELADQARKDAHTERTEIDGKLDKVGAEVKDATRRSIAQIEESIRSALAEFARLDLTGLEDAQLVDTRDNLETHITKVKEHEQEFLRHIRAQLESINLHDDLSQVDEIEALEQRNLTLEEQADLDLQLVQLGMAIEVINHEFDASIRGIRNELRRLKGWADVNQGLQPLYEGLRTNFEHLDGYLSLFTPLHRRLYRQEVEISGADIYTYLQDLFNRRFERHNIELSATRQFLKKKIIGYPSSFYPAFVNLIDNAVFWLKDHATPRIILLDVEDDSFLISNNGPDIPERRQETIFEQGVSYKPGGRGLGLFISRQALEKAGYRLTLIPSQPDMGVTFRIAPKKTD